MEKQPTPTSLRLLALFAVWSHWSTWLIEPHNAFVFHWLPFKQEKGGRKSVITSVCAELFVSLLCTGVKAWWTLVHLGRSLYLWQSHTICSVLYCMLYYMSFNNTQTKEGLYCLPQKTAIVQYAYSLSCRELDRYHSYVCTINMKLPLLYKL